MRAYATERPKKKRDELVGKICLKRVGMAERCTWYFLQGFFKSNIKKDLSFIGTNFQKTKPNKEKIDDISTEYTRILFKDGFSFQQQYAVTKQMDGVLSSDPKLRAVYLKLLEKIDELIKDNLLYKDYTKIYPSPELQIKWLSPEKKIL